MSGCFPPPPPCLFPPPCFFFSAFPACPASSRPSWWRPASLAGPWLVGRLLLEKVVGCQLGPSRGNSTSHRRFEAALVHFVGVGDADSSVSFFRQEADQKMSAKVFDRSTGTLMAAFKNLKRVPSAVYKEYGDEVLILNFKGNRLEDGRNLRRFPNLHTLVLDDNGLETLSVVPTLPKVHTLWLNNNNFQNLAGRSFEGIACGGVVVYVLE